MPKCTNSNPGTFNHECGKPATWAGTWESGHVQYFCDKCKQHGYEAQRVKTWEPLPTTASSETAYGRTVNYPFSIKIF